MLSASNELGTIKRKRKKQINEYDPFGIEEEKEYKSKRQKQNEDTVVLNHNRNIWFKYLW